MAKLEVKTGADFDMTKMDLDFDGQVQASPSHIRVTYEAGWYNDFYGSFEYDARGNVTGGTLTGLSETVDGDLSYQVTGANADAQQFLAYVDEEDIVGAQKYVLRGDDKLTGGAGADHLLAFDGKDTLDGGKGIDILEGGKGNDTYIVNSAKDEVIETKTGGDADLVKSSATYTLAKYVEDLILTGDSKIDGTGNTGDNEITGNKAANTLKGSDGDDTLIGGKGNDTLSGGDDNDTLVGGAGLDTLKGGAGKDVFKFADGDLGTTAKTADLISDFSHKQGDKIDLTHVDANDKGSRTAFEFIGKEAFHGKAGELHVETIGGDTYLVADTDGDKKGELFIHFDGKVAIDDGDFSKGSIILH